MKEKVCKVFEYIYSKIFLLFMLTLSFYFTLDGALLNVGSEVKLIKIIASLSLVLMTFFSIYVLRYVLNIPIISTRDVPPELIKRPKRYVIIGFIVMTVLTFAFLFGYYFLVPDNTGIKTAYYSSQPCYQVLLAPIMEELMFRYLLYDCWARKKMGRTKGAFVVALIFILFHFPANLHMFVLYCIPVVFLFLFYEQFGLYGSILAHMIYNIFAL